MSKWAHLIPLNLNRLATERRGVAALAFVAAATMIIGAMGLAVDVGVVWSAKQALQANTDAAALAGAYQWNQPSGGQSAAITAAQAWNTSNPVPFVTSIKATASAVCATTSGLPTCPTGGANAVSIG